MSKYIKASVRYEAMCQVDDTVGLFKLAELVPEMKKKLLNDLKRNIVEKSEKLTEDMLTYEEVIMPAPTINQGNK